MNLISLGIIRVNFKVITVDQYLSIYDFIQFPKNIYFTKFMFFLKKKRLQLLKQLQRRRYLYFKVKNKI